MPVTLTVIGMTIVNSAILTQVAIAVVTMAVTTLVGSLLRPKIPEIESQARKVTIRSGVAPCRVIYGQYFGGGVLVYAATSGGNEKYLHLVIVHCCHEVEAIKETWFGDLNSDSNRFFGFTRINHHLGTDDQLADADLVHDVGAWTDEHRLRGCAYSYIRLTFDDDEDDPLWTSVPQIKFLVKGKNDIEDPRTGLKGYTNNWALCVRDYLMYKNGMNVTADRLPHDEWVAAANVCDETFQGKPKYVMNGGFTLDGQPPDILEGMKSAAQGQIVYTGGLWVAKPAAYDAPVKVITTDDLVEDIVVTPAQSKFDTANIVAGSFVEPRALWASTSYPPVKNQTDIDRYREATDTVDLPWTIDVHIAQMLAGIRLGHMMHSAAVSLKCNLSAMDIRAWDVIELDIPEIWNTKKAFRVVDADISMEGVQLVCSEENPDIYVPVATTDIEIPDRVHIGHPSNDPPVAAFNFTTAKLVATFTDTSSDSDGQVVEWEWDFGDSSTSKEEHPVHTYTIDGTFKVVLKVTDNDGATDIAEHSVTVSATNASPVAAFTFGVTQLDVSFSDRSHDSDGHVVGWAWDFGDGNTSTDQNPAHTYAANGTFTAQLTVTDNDGATNSISRPVTVSDVVPPLPPGSPLTGDAADYLTSPADYTKYARSYNALSAGRIYPEGKEVGAGVWLGGFTMSTAWRHQLGDAGCNNYVANAGQGYYENTIAGIKEYAALGIKYIYQIRDPFLSRTSLDAAIASSGDTRYNSSGVPSAAEEARLRLAIRNEVTALVADSTAAGSISGIMHYYEELKFHPKHIPVVKITFDELNKGPLAGKRMAANSRSDASYGPHRANEFKSRHQNEFCYQMYTYCVKTASGGKHCKKASRRRKEIFERAKMSLVNAETGGKFVTTAIIDPLYPSGLSYRHGNVTYHDQSTVLDMLGVIGNGATGLYRYYWNNNRQTDVQLWRNAYIKALTLLMKTTDALNAMLWGETRGDVHVTVTTGAGKTVYYEAIIYNDVGRYSGFTDPAHQSFIKEFNGKQYIVYLNFDEPTYQNSPGADQVISINGFTGTARDQLKATVYTYDAATHSHKAVVHNAIGASLTGIRVPALSYALIVLEPGDGFTH